MTQNHNYNTPHKGTQDWHIPLNDNFRAIDRDMEIRDAEANLSAYAPAANAKFLATDTGRRYVGDGSSWTRLSYPVDSGEGSPNRVNMVAAGADPSGEEPIDAVLDREAGDDTVLLFPPGTYKLGDEFALSGTENFSMVGIDGSQATTLKIEGDFAASNMFNFGQSGSVAVSGLTFQGFTIDMRGDGVGAGVFWIHCRDRLRVADVNVVGTRDDTGVPSGRGEFLMRADITEETGYGVVEGLTSLDGANDPSSGDPPTGIYSGALHNGTITYKDCSVVGYQDNGLYTSAAGKSQTESTVIVEGGYFANNDISNIRLGADNTYVTGARIEMTDDSGMRYGNPRGLWVRRGNCVVDSCTVVYDEGDSNAIEIASAAETVQMNNVKVEMNTNEPALRVVADDSNTAVRKFRDCVFAGSGDGSSSYQMVKVAAPYTVFENCTVDNAAGRSSNKRAGIDLLSGADNCAIVGGWFNTDFWPISVRANDCVVKDVGFAEAGDGSEPISIDGSAANTRIDGNLNSLSGEVDDGGDRTTVNNVGFNGSADPASGGEWNGNGYEGVMVAWLDGSGAEKVSVYRSGRWFPLDAA
ncbi:hypothetical protein [Haladaptatus sp. DYSN1]|uniref:hypothetical protein n=1 Tax=unclassified Haladaptatus TaxID=2622732 RepID=UPI0024057A2C|nr:hypothetical protein [Haladaptatus sp. DYSN1]